MTADLQTAIRDLSDAERRVLAREWITVARGLAGRGHRGAAHLFHMLAVELAEEGDRQAAILDALARALDDDDDLDGESP